MNEGKVKLALIGVLLILVSFHPAVATARNGDNIEAMRQTSKAFSAVAKKVVPAVVSIRVESTVRAGSNQYGAPSHDDFFERFFGRKYPRRPDERQDERPQVGQGSGFIISSDGYILTNNHVVGNADKIVVTLNDGRKFDDAKLIGTDPKSEVAVIRIDGENLPVVELGDSDKLEIGEWVIAVGNPFGLTETVTVGVVSAKGRTVGITDEGYEDFIQTDAAINPGNSGGPLLDLDGRAIGINTAIFSQSGGYMGIGFAIPIDMAKEIKNQLIESGKVTRGYLGIYMDNVDQDIAEFFELELADGVLVSRVVENSPADKAGLKKRDIILKLNGKVIEDLHDLRNAVSLMVPGTRVTLDILRDGEEKEIRVKIGTLPEETVVRKEPQSVVKLGLRVEDLTEEVANRFGYEVGDGVIVVEVASDSPAGRAEIEPGTLVVGVNRNDISSVAEFNEALKASSKNRVLLLLRNESYIWYEVLYLE